MKAVPWARAVEGWRLGIKSASTASATGIRRISLLIAEYGLEQTVFPGNPAGVQGKAAHGLVNARFMIFLGSLFKSKIPGVGKEG